MIGDKQRGPWLDSIQTTHLEAVIPGERREELHRRCQRGRIRRPEIGGGWRLVADAYGCGCLEIRTSRSACHGLEASVAPTEAQGNRCRPQEDMAILEKPTMRCAMTRAAPEIQRD